MSYSPEDFRVGVVAEGHGWATEPEMRNKAAECCSTYLHKIPYKRKQDY